MATTHRTGTRDMDVRVAAAGAAMFARYAYPPDDVGHTVADHARELRDYAPGGLSAPALGQQLRAYVASLPALTQIAHTWGTEDPLDVRVVEAYWVGVPTRGRMGMDVTDHHHNASVLITGPWRDLLRGESASQALHALDQCRVRWGRVINVQSDSVTVRSRPLVFANDALSLSEPHVETVALKPEGASAPARVRQGDWCAMHWGWLADRLTTRQLVQLRRVTRTHIEAVNARVVAQR